MNSFIITIITVNLNNAPGLEKTIASVASQSGKNVQYIIIDGGSSDESVSIIKKHESVISFWVSERDSGIYEAMNKGILKASGEYLLFLNSGDTLCDTNTIENAVTHLNTREDIVYGNLKISENGKITEGFMPDVIDLRQMMNDTLWHPVSFIKKNLFDNYGLYNTEYRIVGDYEFFFRVIISKKVTLKHINQFIAVFDLNGISSSPKNTETIKLERKKVQSAYLSEPEIEQFLQNEIIRQQQSKKSFFRKWFR